MSEVERFEKLRGHLVSARRKEQKCWEPVPSSLPVG
jgi:hypothetical protein